MGSGRPVGTRSLKNDTNKYTLRPLVGKHTGLEFGAMHHVSTVLVDPFAVDLVHDRLGGGHGGIQRDT